VNLDALTRDEAETLPVFEDCAEHELDAFYLWRDFTDTDYTFFVRPVAVDESGCLADVFVIRDDIVKPLGHNWFIREGGRLRLLEE
jgi:hypothetical protein